MSNWQMIDVTPDHINWASFSKAMKIDTLDVTEDDPYKDVVIRVTDPVKSNKMKHQVLVKYKITTEYVTPDISTVSFYKNVELGE